jgi:hypothetical protein
MFAIALAGCEPQAAPPSAPAPPPPPTPSTPAQPQPGPVAVVTALYRLDAAPLVSPDTAGLLASDVIGAAGRDSDPALDYRFGSMGPGTAYVRSLSAAGASPAVVSATVTVGDAQQTVQWRLCRDDAGDWRVYDASDGHYSLRGRLRLSETEIDCG